MRRCSRCRGDCPTARHGNSQTLLDREGNRAGMVDETTLQAQLDAELQEHLAAGRAIYYGDRRLAAGVIKEYSDGRRDEVAFDAQGQEQVLRGLPPVTREPTARLWPDVPKSAPGAWRFSF